jgi:hypothetical protein
MYGTHTLAFQRIFVRMKIIALIFIRFSYVSLTRNSVTGPLRAVHSSSSTHRSTQACFIIQAIIYTGKIRPDKIMA